MRDKFYFRTEDDIWCYSLDYYLNEADFEEITLIEAVPVNSDTGYIYCGYQQEVSERSECKKHICPHYNSKSGRGVCKHRGQLFEHGEKVTFKIQQFKKAIKNG